MKILDLIFPKFCYGCRKIGEYLCSNCLKDISILKFQKCPKCMRRSSDGKFCKFKCKRSYYFDQLIVCSDYQKNPILNKIIHDFKYRYCKDLKDLLGSILDQQLENFDLKDYYLVPVPMHKSNLRERGFNQSLLLAEYLKDFRLLDCLEKIELTQNQSKLNKKDRLINLNGSFSLKAKHKTGIKNKKIVLLDDVATTLSTLNECTKVLKNAGARTVTGLVLARA